MSETRSTTRPITMLCTSATTMALRSLAVVDFMPSLWARSMIGITVPRRFITPMTSGGECGMGVEGAQPRISRIVVVLTQNS
ncbi:hypothetical protein D3C71_2011950 [compost metagenome]